MRKLTMMVLMVMGASLAGATQASACGTRPFGRHSGPMMQIGFPTPGELAGMLVAEQARARHEMRVETGLRVGRWMLGAGTSSGHPSK